MQLDTPWKASVLATANTFVVALGFAIMAELGHDVGWGFGIADVPPMGTLVFYQIAVLGFLPALLSGALLARIADTLDGGPGFRFTILGFIAVACVVTLGIIASWPELTAGACIPTLVCVSIFERWTRTPPQVPAATLVVDQPARRDSIAVRISPAITSGPPATGSGGDRCARRSRCSATRASPDFVSATVGDGS